MKKEARLLRCTLLNGSAWSTKRKYMRRHKGRCDIFFGIEHRLCSSLTWRQRKDEDLRLMRQESQTKEQVLRIRSTHQELFL